MAGGDGRRGPAFTTSDGAFSVSCYAIQAVYAPATFQTLMDLVLAGLQWKVCLVYLDDVIMLGQTFKENIKNLHKVLDRLHEAGLHLKPSKCCFFREQLTYLGHVIS